MKDVKNELNDVLQDVQTVVFDLDGTLYDKRGLAGRIVSRLWWCMPMLAAERLARRAMKNKMYDSAEAFYEAFFEQMAKGHYWTGKIADKWYNKVYLPTMVRAIHRYHHPREEVMAIVREGQRRGLTMAIYSDYGCVEDKLHALGIDPELFEVRIDAPATGGLKPAKGSVNKLMKMLGADPKTTLFVGDRDDKDGEAARVVGAKYLKINND